jgi:tRNA threonylcarbamoyladenosine biosynthesis protein TsaB
MMTSLAFDTSLSATSVALSHEGRIFHAQDQTAGSQATRLIPMIEAVLAEAGIHYADLQRLIVTTGPGSFTGLRIGLASAQGILAVHPLRLHALGTLEAIARTVAQTQPDGAYWATLNAGKGEIAAQLFHLRDAIPHAASEILRLKPDALSDHIKTGESILSDILPDARAFVNADLPPCDPAMLLPHYIREADAKPSAIPT